MNWLPGLGMPRPMHDAREYDAIVASGEQVTAGLLAISLQAMGIEARSWLGLADTDHDRQRPWLGAHQGN